MHVGQDAVAQRRLARLAAPGLRPAEEEALRRRETLERFVGLARARQRVAVPRGREARDVGDVLAEGQLAVDRQVREWLVLVVLRRERGTRGFEAREIVLGPPVREASGFIEQGAAVVEAVRDLVADHAADRAVVDRVVGGRIEERRLQDRGREDQPVLERHVERIDGLRQQKPFAVVDRLAELGEVAAVLELAGALRVAECIVAADFERRIVAPPVRIAHADAQRRELGLRARLGVCAHPVDRIDALVERGDEVVDHFVRARLGLRREMLLDVELADRLAERVVDLVDRALPAVLLLRRARQRVAVEREMRVAPGLGQVRRRAIERMEREPVLPRIERLGGHQRREAADRIGLPDDEILLAREAGCVEEPVPVEAGSLAREIGALPRVRALLHVVGLLLRRMCACDRGFEREHARGLRIRVGDAREPEQLRRVRLVLLAQFGEASSFEVEVAVGQAEAALHQVRRVAVGLVQVLRDPQAEQAIGVVVGRVEQVDVRAQVRAERTRERGAVGECGDRVEFGLQRREAVLLDRGVVHERGVEVADAACVALRIGVVRCAFDDRARVLLGLLDDHGEAAIARTIGRDLGVVEPGAVRELVEVVAWPRIAPHAGEVDAEAAERGPGRSRRLARRGRCHRGRGRLGGGGRRRRAIAAGDRHGDEGSEQDGTNGAGHGAPRMDGESVERRRRAGLVQSTEVTVRWRVRAGLPTRRSP